MEQLFHLAIEFIKHLRDPDTVYKLIKDYNTVFYSVFFLIIFVETGLIVMPFLPGDSLLFVAGAAIAATGALKLEILIPLLVLAALMGDNVNYFVGKFFGEQIKKREKVLFFKRKYLEETEAYYARYGGQTVILARFMPIVRTIAPFVAGAGSMSYTRYIIFCITGAVLWVGGVTMLGYYFGGIPVIKANFDKVLILVVIISVMPIGWKILQEKFFAKKA